MSVWEEGGGRGAVHCVQDNLRPGVPRALNWESFEQSQQSPQRQSPLSVGEGLGTVCLRGAFACITSLLSHGSPFPTLVGGGGDQDVEVRVRKAVPVQR